MRLGMTIVGTIFCLCIAFTLKAQQKHPLFDKIDSYNKTFPKEKLYLTFDKPYYNAGDTIWFKSVLLNSRYSTDTSLSDKIYVELFNDSARLIERKVFLLNNGLGYGDLSLAKTLSDGSYSIRAYSNWQQNFGADYFFQKTFYVGNVKESTWLLETSQKLTEIENKRSLNLSIKLTTINKQAVGLRDVEIYVMNGQKRLMRADLQTSIDGRMETSIDLFEKKIEGSYNLFIVDKKDRSKSIKLPILLQELNEIDLQFMPEGGSMVNGIYGKVAFKCINADGLGKEIEGNIVNNKNEVITTFKSNKKGMGSFYLSPRTGENYFAIYSLPGKAYRNPLIAAKDAGTTLRIDPFSKPDSIYIYIKASEDKRIDQAYHLVAQALGHTAMTISFSLKNGFSNLLLPKKDFPDGIVHFTLFSPNQQPLNERRVFINHSKSIAISTHAAQNNYTTRDSISLEITAKNEDGMPISGSFSVSVTDDGQVKQEKNEANMISYFLLQSELKGNIEEPSWYFSNHEPSTLLALDHLLLTQGWVGYRWNDILESEHQIKFNSEKANIIQGNVTGLIKKPLSNLNLTLLSMGKTLLMMDTITNSEGKFKFLDLPILDTAQYLIKVTKINGKTPSSTIYVDEFKPSLIILGTKPVYPLYINPTSTMISFYKNGANRIKQAENTARALTGTSLKEVEIKGFRKDLLVAENWDANLLRTVGEEELKKMPRKTLFDVMKEKLPGFTRSRWWQTCDSPIIQHPVEDFVVGSKHVSWIRIDKAKTVTSVPKEFFDYLYAEDVKNIEIYKGCVSYYLDIITRTGDGLNGVYRPNGLYLYRPLVTNFSRDFYSPKYAVDKTAAVPDLRSTIFWDANVVTDENGKAKLSFYAADLPGSYTIKVEGTDLLGRFGYQKSTITIKNKTDSK